MIDRFNTMVNAVSSEPIFWLTATLASFAFGQWLFAKTNHNTLFTPFITCVVIVIALLLATGTDYKTYFEGGQYIHFLLGPATVALAVPLYEQRERLIRMWIPLVAGLLAGGTVAIVSAVGIAAWLGASDQTIISLAPKSVTVPIAVGISENLGGIGALTASLVAITGVFGAVVCKSVFAVMGEKDEAIRGFAIGLSSHGMGTSAAFQMSRDTGAFSGLAMGLTGLFTAFTAPALVPWLMEVFR